MTDPPPDPVEPSHQRVSELMALVGTREPAVSEGFTPGLVGRARTQHAIVVPLRALGIFLTALAGAVAGALGSDDRGPQA
jgi:hypothetical protein